MADDKTKKYPWTKSIFGRKRRPRAECVYAGPERMNRRAQGAKETDGGPEPEREASVYAGPEPEPERDAEVDFEDVYAGPEYFFGRNGDEDPEDPEEPYEAAEEEPGEGKTDGGEKTGKTVPPNRPDPAAMQGVYAGPAVPGGGFVPPFPATMAVYAGPPFPRPVPVPGVRPSPRADALEEQTPEVLCGSCGEKLRTGARYCTACGAKAPKQRFCPGCGFRLEREMSFCPECGTKLAFPPACETCGAVLEGGEKYCPVCGAELGAS